MIEVVSGESMDVIMRLCAGWDRGQRGLQLMHTRHGWRARYLDEALVPSAGAGERVTLTGTLFETIQESEVMAGFVLLPPTDRATHLWMAWLVADDGGEVTWMFGEVQARLSDYVFTLATALDALGGIATRLAQLEYAHADN